MFQVYLSETRWWSAGFRRWRGCTDVGCERIVQLCLKRCDMSTTEPRVMTPLRLPDDVDSVQASPTLCGSNLSVAASPLDSPMVRRAAVNLLLGVPSSANDSISSWSLDDQTTTTDDSCHTTPLHSHSPLPTPATQRRRSSKRFNRNELWSAIKSDYLYLMDEEIIDACKVE